jgi:UDP-N-acetyl-D-glucosamine dehydrogenase
MAGRSYIPDVPSEHLAEVVNNGKFVATTDPKKLADADIIDICVPTPLRKTKDPDMTYVVQAVEAVAAVLRKGQLIILESTTYPGTTVEVVQPTLAAKGFKPGVDFYLAFLPSASTRAIRNIRPRTFRRWSAASTKTAPGPRSRSTRR